MNKVTRYSIKTYLNPLRRVTLKDLESMRTKTKVYFETKELVTLEHTHRTQEQIGEQIFQILSDIEYVYIEDKDDIKIKLDKIWRILNRLYKFIWNKSPRPTKAEFQSMMKPYNNFINFIVDEGIYNEIFEIFNKNYPIYNGWWVKYQEKVDEDEDDFQQQQVQKLYNEQTFNNLSQNFEQSNYFKLQQSDRLYLHSNPQDFDGIIFQINILNRDVIKKQVQSLNQTLNDNQEDNQKMLENQSLIVGENTQENNQIDQKQMQYNQEQNQGQKTMQSSIQSLQHLQKNNNNSHNQSQQKSSKYDVGDYEIKKNKRSKAQIDSKDRL
ncbi:hypothetical protein PPERSA_04680 [Pseudocohnilembus persalinus]|uniref:Uncharacterized protein n=1 Tax=Pseudocohnilembus persalinus TaxID=266149 RepID=A0A0V0R4I1_PSEPJ|nr:hypothetical protein PPERSA_04680 [Pseudocohnilembus persalinus]|eukprot:KRX09374.1 hypothetical protein PPERSA_04680 [Pseudocohnilembus persalinus]